MISVTGISVTGISVKERLRSEIETISDFQAQQVAAYLHAIKVREGEAQADDEAIGALYAQFAEEDRLMAEEGMADYHAGLLREDSL